MSGDSGLSRRQVLARGAVVAGVAWTAPMLMATQASAVGLSVCTGTNFICGPTALVPACCLAGDNCSVLDNGTAVCSGVGSAGGSCGNEGQGQCKNPYKCNGNSDQCNNCASPNVCGGEGAQCCVATDCFGDLVCTPQAAAGNIAAAKFCRKKCTGTGTECATGQICRGGFCAEPCTASSQCLGRAICLNGVCNYQSDGGTC